MDQLPPPNELSDSSRTQFWVKRWERDKLPWDLGHVPPDLVAFLKRGTTAPCRVLVPGCGSGYEVAAFHDSGFDVTAIDFSGPAVAHAREVLGALGDKVIQANLFKHDFAGQRFGLIYERGFLCSLPVSKWEEWIGLMAELILPGGRLVGLFLYGDEPEPPPYPLSEETAARLFSRFFRLECNQPAARDTVPVYRGLERWQEWKRLT